MDFMFSLCVNDGNGDTYEKPERDKALLGIVEAVIVVGESRPLKDLGSVYEVKPVITKVAPSLRLVPVNRIGAVYIRRVEAARAV